MLTTEPNKERDYTTTLYTWYVPHYYPQYGPKYNAPSWTHVHKAKPALRINHVMQPSVGRTR